jgi:hypothetical protein
VEKYNIKELSTRKKKNRLFSIVEKTVEREKKVIHKRERK